MSVLRGHFETVLLVARSVVATVGHFETMWFFVRSMRDESFESRQNTRPSPPSVASTSTEPATSSGTMSASPAGTLVPSGRAELTEFQVSRRPPKHIIKSPLTVTCASKGPVIDCVIAGIDAAVSMTALMQRHVVLAICIAKDDSCHAGKMNQFLM